MYFYAAIGTGGTTINIYAYPSDGTTPILAQVLNAPFVPGALTVAGWRYTSSETLQAFVSTEAGVVYGTPMDLSTQGDCRSFVQGRIGATASGAVYPFVGAIDQFIDLEFSPSDLEVDQAVAAMKENSTW